MPTANEELADLSTRHAVGLQRLASGVVEKIIPILNRSDEEIVAKLRARGATLEGSFTSERLKSLLDAIREINRDAHVEIGRELRKELRDLSKYEAGYQQRMIGKALPIQWDIVTPSAEMLNAVVTSRPFQGKLLREWVSELEAGRARRVRDAVRQGMVQGETIDQIVRRVRGSRAMQYKDGVLEVSRRGAEAMVRTAVNHTASASREMLYEENSDLIKSVQWVATLDTRTCPECMALDGTTFEMGKGKRPPAHIGCRCTTAPVTKSWRELGVDIDEVPEGTRASMNGQVPQSQDFGTWLGKQPASVQDEALGPTRGKLFRQGSLPVDKFTNRRGDQWTLEQLRQREREAFEADDIAA